MIDNIIALTIPRSLDRQWLYYGRMTAMGVPPEKIIFFRGADARKFDNDYNAIADAAEADGYPFIRQFQGYKDILRTQQHPAQMAQMWAYAQILRYIIEKDQTVLVTWDDRYLTVPFQFLNEIVSRLQGIRDFYMFQLRIRGSRRELIDFLKPVQTDDPWGNNELWQKMQLTTEMFRLATNPGLLPNFDNLDVFVRQGMFGYDETIVFSKKGAELLLNTMMEMEDIDPDIKKMDQYDVAPSQMPAYGCRLNVDSYLHWGFIKTALPKIMTADLGIYCPRSLGYDFIEDAIPMGSLTQWANPAQYFSEKNNETTTLQYIR